VSAYVFTGARRSERGAEMKRGRGEENNVLAVRRRGAYVRFRM